MNKNSFVLALFLCAAGLVSASAQVQLDDAHAQEIGRRLWVNEASGKVALLTYWDKGEEFPSLGIGHFIWYPAGYKGPFVESFPLLLDFLRENKIVLPLWLKGQPVCPWKTRAQFYQDFNSDHMKELRQILLDTVAWQARFAARRLEAALPKMLEAVPTKQRDQVRAQFNRVARSPLGMYALVDYVNFKGEGTALTERYNGQGWGLLQVLQTMKGSALGPEALDEFTQAARAMLERRVKNSPPTRNEKHWLPIWDMRLDTYRQPAPQKT